MPATSDGSACDGDNDQRRKHDDVRRGSMGPARSDPDSERVHRAGHPNPELMAIFVGQITAPVGTGVQNYQMLDFDPRLVIFMGSNQASEDTNLSITNGGVFMGMMGKKWDDENTIQQRSVSIIPGSA